MTREDEEIDGAIDRWHEGEGEGLGLHEFLGMTWGEYRLWAEDRHSCEESDGMTDTERLTALRDHLDVIEGNCPGEWKMVSGDVRHHDVPGDRQHMNTNASWIVGPTSRSRFDAERARAALLALFDLIRRSGD